MSLFLEDMPEWNNVGAEPSAQKKTDGWLPTEKPPADWFNWLFNRGYKSIEEIRNIIDGINDDTIGDLSTLTTTEKASLVGAINEINEELSTPDTLSLTLDKDATITSVLDSYASPSDVSVEGASLYQAITNGNFASGTTGWSADGATLSVTSRIMSVTANGTKSNPAINRINTYGVGSSNVTKFRFRVTNSLCTSVRIFTGSEVVVVTAPLENIWYDVCVINTHSSATLAIYHRYADAATANGKVMQIDGTDTNGVMAIPVTGTPYSAYTADQMNVVVNEYFGGLKSAESVSFGSRGKNIFDGVVEIGDISSTTGLDTASTTRQRTDFYRVDASSQYTISPTSAGSPANFQGAFFYDKQKNPIAVPITFYALLTSATSTTFTTPANASFVRFRTLSLLTEALIQNIMFNKGATALPHEDWEGSSISITCNDNTLFDNAQLPNLVSNSVDLVGGKFSATKRVKRATILTATVINTTNLSDAKLNGSFYLVQDDGVIVSSIVDGNTTTTDAGVIIYELATPVIKQEEDFAVFDITVTGSLSSNLDYTEYFVDDYDILPSSIDIEYAGNISRAVEQLKNSTTELKDAQMDTILELLTLDAKIIIEEGKIDDHVLVTRATTFGTADINQSITGSSTQNIDIALGGTYNRARVVIMYNGIGGSNGYKNIICNCTTTNTETHIVGFVLLWDGSNATITASTWTRNRLGRISEYSDLSATGYAPTILGSADLRINECFISGTNLRITIQNDNTSAITANFLVDYETWNI